MVWWQGRLTRRRSDLALKKQGNSGAGSPKEGERGKLPRNETDNLTHSQPVVLGFSLGSGCVRAEKSCYRFNALRYTSIVYRAGWDSKRDERAAFDFGLYRCSPLLSL